MSEIAYRFIMIENPHWDARECADWLATIPDLELRLDKAMEDVDRCGVDPRVQDLLSILRSRMATDAIQLLGAVVSSESMAVIDSNSNLAKAVVLLWAAGLLSCWRDTFIMTPAEDVEMDDDLIRMAVLDILEAEDESVDGSPMVLPPPIMMCSVGGWRPA
jgi:hypothetical protein